MEIIHCGGISVEDAARILGVGEKSVMRLIAMKRLPAYLVGAHWRIPPRVVEWGNVRVLTTKLEGTALLTPPVRRHFSLRWAGLPRILR